MILAYEFDCASENFAFFLKFYAQKSGLNFNLKKEHDLTTLYTEGSQEELLAFSDLLSSALPHSIFLRGSKVYASENSPGVKTSEPQNTLSNITPSVVSAYLKGELKECENGVFSDVCVFADGKFTPVTKANFSELLEFAFKKFKFSARSFNKILKLTRTIADLDGSEEIKEEHLLEAIRYRSLSNKYWS